MRNFIDIIHTFMREIIMIIYIFMRDFIDIIHTFMREMTNLSILFESHYYLKKK